MKKVVLVAPYFLPRRRVGAWRPFKFAIHLKNFGWEPHVITIQETKGALTQKEKSLLSGIPIHKIKSPFDFTHRLNNGFAYNGFSENSSSATTQSFSPAKTVLNWVDKQFPVDSWLPLFVLRRGYIEGVIEEIAPDLLWSTGDPWSSHWLGAKLAETFHLPWIADFRDPWTLGDINLKNRSSFSYRVDQKEEGKVLKKASMLTFNAQKTEELYKSNYQNLNIESSTIYNCFDSTLFNEAGEHSQLFSQETLNLVFFGKFRPLSPATQFIHLLERFYKTNEQAAEKIRMYSFGELSKSEMALAREKGVNKNLVFLEHIPLEEALPVLKKADLLWLSTHPSRKNIIPAKLWDYLAAKRPIVSVAPNPEISEILDHTGAGIQLDVNNYSSLVDLLALCVEAKQNGRPMPVPVSFDDNAIKQYDAVPATRKLAGIFDSLT